MLSANGPRGYQVSFSRAMKNGYATGEYEDFLTGFVSADGQVWGRPVGVAVGHDGALYVSDDGSRSTWRVSYSRKRVSTGITELPAKFKHGEN